MARERGSNPTRRGPSRSGRASFEQDGSSNAGTENDSDEQPHTSEQQRSGMVDSAAGKTNTNPRATYSTENGALMDETAAVGDDHGADDTRNYKSTTSNTNDNDSDSHYASPAVAPPPPTETLPEVASPAPRGRGRPRKKGNTVSTAGAASAVTTAPLPTTPKASEALPMTQRGSGSSSVAAASGSSAVNGQGSQWGGGSGDGEVEGNESDEWSEEDNVHYLPSEIKAQFGNVRYARGLLAVLSEIL